MKMRKLIMSLGLLVIAFGFVFNVAFVQAAGDSGASGQSGDSSATAVSQTGPSATLQNPLGDKISDVPTLLNTVIGVVISFSYIVVACFLIWSGFKFVTAQGNESKITSAKTTFYWTIIGALIVMGAQTLSSVFQETLKSLGK